MSVHPQVRITVKPYASALPLGFFSFGLGMLLLAAEGAGWVKAAEMKEIGLLLATFVFPLELLSAVIAFLSRDTMAAAALGVFSTSWLAVGLSLREAQPGVLSAAFGVYLLGFCAITVALGIAALFGKPLIAFILLLATARTACAGIYELGGGAGWEHVGGWLALVIFVLSMYGGLAFLLEDSTGKSVLPVWRRGASQQAMEGSLAEQLQRLDSEAGIRQTL